MTRRVCGLSGARTEDKNSTMPTQAQNGRMLKVSTQRAEAIVQSEIRAMSIECERVQGVNLAQGVCDTPLPREVAEAAKAAIDRDCNSYTRYDGIAELRRAIAQKLCTYNHIKADAETQITVTAGSTGAFYCACLALLSPGDEVILFEPFYGYHVNTLRATQAVPAYVTMQSPDWSFTPADLEAAITPRTKAILVNTPANPSGKVFTATELEWIADLATKHDLLVFTDEIYEYFLYDGRKHISPAALPGMEERTITISGFSKTYSITGWRLGYSCCQPEWARIIGYMNDLVYVCAPSPLQWGAAAGLSELSSQFYSDLANEYGAKRDQLCQTLEDIRLNPCWPQGAYYVLADVSRLPGKNSKDRAMYLLEQTGVAAVPGSAFYHSSAGENLVRFCYAKTDAELDSACERLSALR
jgi:aminotransferase